MIYFIMGFNTHSIDGKKYNYDANLAPEIKEFWKDGKIDKREEGRLKSILKYNEKRDRNKDILIQTTKPKLELLKEMVKKTVYVKNQVDKILSLSESTSSKKKTVNSSQKGYIWENGTLRGVSKRRLDQILDPSKAHNLSITLSSRSLYKSSMDGKTFSVEWGKDKKTGRDTYIFSSGPAKGRRVLIWNGDKIYGYNQTSENISKNRKRRTVEASSEKTLLSDRRQKSAERHMSRVYTKEQRREIAKVLWIRYTNIPTLVKAVAKYQENNRLPVVGQVGPQTRWRLGIRFVRAVEKLNIISEKKETGFTTRLSQKLSKFVTKKWPAATWTNSCGRAVGTILNRFWIRWLPQSWRDGYKWNWFLTARSRQFKRVRIFHPSQAPDGSIITFGKNAKYGTNIRKRKGHVEVRARGAYTSYYKSNQAAGSSLRSYAKAKRISPSVAEKRLTSNPKEYKKVTAFDWYAFVPIKKA